jgi:hypothetical protein
MRLLNAMDTYKTTQHPKLLMRIDERILACWCLIAFV